jgi:hypothetical protein
LGSGKAVKAHLLLLRTVLYHLRMGLVAPADHTLSLVIYRHLVLALELS